MDKTEIDQKIRSEISMLLKEQGLETINDLNDNSILLETGLDSLGYAILVTRLENSLGYDPFTLLSEPVYPRTYGEFLNLYVQLYPENRGND